MSVRRRSPASCGPGRRAARCRATPRSTTRSCRQDQAMIVAFVRMAGESRPWGIAWGTVGSDPRIAVCSGWACPRRRGRSCAPTFAEDLLAHLRVHNWTYDPVAQRRRAGRPAPGVAAERPARRDAAPAELHVLADEVRRREPGHPAGARAVGRLDVPRHARASATSTSSSASQRSGRRLRVPGAGRPHRAPRLPARMARPRRATVMPESRRRRRPRG